MFDFTNCRVLVTGGTTGIGLATARRFLEGGARVVITGNNAARLEAALAQLGAGASGIAVDVARLAETRRIAAFCESSLGGLDVIVANAGICLTSRIDSLDEAEYDREFDTNVKGAIWTVSHCLPLMGKGGAILFTTSVNDCLGLPGQLVYSATKAALRSMVRTLAAELAPRGIRVNAVAPGPINTPIFDKFSADPSVVAAAKAFESGMTLAGRLGEPDEIANAFAFLASPAASYVNGVDFRVDGGWGDI